MILKDFAANLDRVFLGHRVKAPGIPCGLRTFHDEGRGVIIELIGVRPDPAMGGFFKYKSKRIVEFGVRAKPDELAQARINIGLENSFVFAPHGGV